MEQSGPKKKAGPGKSKGRGWIRKAILIVAAALAVVVVWFAVNRLSSASRAVSIHELTIGSPEPPVFSGTLKLATFNIAHGRGTNESNLSRAEDRHPRLEKIAALLKAEQVDIAVLQEVDFDAVWTGHEDEAAFIAQAAGFRYVLEQRNFDVAIPLVRLRWGNAILSRYRIAAGRLVPLPVLSKREQLFAGAKQAACGDVELTPDLRIRILSVHMEPRDEATRVRCADIVLDEARHSLFPFFCIGDFNSSPTNFPGAAVDGNGLTLVHVLLDSQLFRTRPTILPAREQLTWPSYAPAVLIDWILVPARWTIQNYEVRATDLSDHRAVFMEVKPP